MARRPDKRSDRAKQYVRWYGTQLWRDIRARQLAAEPWCRACAARNVQTPATVCDHITPHRGDRAKFLDGPFQSLCKTCHDSGKQSQERGGVGFDKGCDEEGIPLWLDQD